MELRRFAISRNEWLGENWPEPELPQDLSYPILTRMLLSLRKGSAVAVFDPIALERMQGIYRDVLASLSKTSGLPEGPDLERIAQDILYAVTANGASREDIVDDVCARAVSRITGTTADENGRTR